MTGSWASVLGEAAERGPSRPAILDGAETVDYARLRDRAAAYAGALGDAGVRPGDRVALLFRRTWDAAAAVFGVLAAGAVAVVVADVLRPRQIEHVVGHSGATVLLVGPAAVRHHRDLRVGARILPAAVDVAAPYRVVPRGADDLAHLVYTSGSTGLAKGVMVSHANLHAGVDAVRRYLGVGPDDRLAGLLPFSFDYGLNQLYLAVGSGAALVIDRSPMAARVDATLRSARVSVVAAVPTLWRHLLGVPRFRHEPVETLRAMTNSGGRLPEVTVRQLRAAQPQAALYSMYGLTEAFRSTYLDPSLVDRKPTSVGRAVPGAEVEVVRADGTGCAPYEVGEIVHRGPTVARGYWRDETASRSVFRPSAGGAVTVHSGDFGWVDDDGDLYVQGRRDRLVKRLGYRVSPDEITETIFASGLVRDACVTVAPTPAVPAVPDGRTAGRAGVDGGTVGVGVADDEGGYTDVPQVVAHVVLAESVTIADLERYLAIEQPRHLQPSRVVVHEALPTTPHGKHDLGALEEAAR